MTRIHASVIALAVAFAVVAGAFAAFRTTQLGTTPTARVSPVVLAVQSRQLDRSAAAVHQALRAHPPRLPRVPRLKKPKLPTGTPPPVVHVVHVAAPAATSTATQPTAVRPAASTRPATTTTVAATKTTTTTAKRPHEQDGREPAERETPGADAHEHTTTTTTTTTTPPGGERDD